jgi:hypothetical protein
MRPYRDGHRSSGTCDAFGDFNACSTTSGSTSRTTPGTCGGAFAPLSAMRLASGWVKGAAEGENKGKGKAMGPPLKAKALPAKEAASPLKGKGKAMGPSASKAQSRCLMGIASKAKSRCRGTRCQGDRLRVRPTLREWQRIVNENGSDCDWQEMMGKGTVVSVYGNYYDYDWQNGEYIFKKRRQSGRQSRKKKLQRSKEQAEGRGGERPTWDPRGDPRVLRAEPAYVEPFYDEDPFIFYENQPTWDPSSYSAEPAYEGPFYNFYEGPFYDNAAENQVYTVLNFLGGR